MTETTKTDTREYKKDQRKRVLYDWLFIDYPSIFNAKNPTPLEERKVKKALHKFLPENVSKIDLKYALKWYSFRMNYLQAILKQTHRINLNGEPVTEITDEDRIEAQVQIDLTNEQQKQYDEKKALEPKFIDPFKEKRKCVLDDWLYQQYPLVFNHLNPIPLAIGIGEELKKQLPETVSLADFKLVMRWYCRRTEYHKAILEQTHRINLQGELVGEVRENDRKLAKDHFNKAQRKQGNVTKSQLKTESQAEIPVTSELIEPEPIKVKETVQPTIEIKSTKLTLKPKTVESTADTSSVKAEPITPAKVTDGNIAIAKGLKVTLVLESASIPNIDSTGMKKVTLTVNVANTDIQVTADLSAKSYRKAINGIEEFGVDGCNAILQGSMKQYGVIDDAGLVVQPKKTASSE